MIHEFDKLAAQHVRDVAAAKATDAYAAFKRTGDPSTSEGFCISPNGDSLVVVTVTVQRREYR